MASERKLFPPPKDYDPVAPLTDAEIAGLRPALEVFAELGLVPPKPLGRPPAERTKVPVTMRLDPDILAAYKATGPGWQTRMGEVLAQAIKKSA
ncbi:BrnA antitoxin family protein [uncultured Devosia sp.]|uniref:BrnA antitoxin family protein n=1 Tax=uncultured Devosia sp. TaxID=211434 RepID=UPI0035CA55E9